MDFQGLVSAFSGPTCIVAVEKTDDGSYGDIRLAAVNAEFLEKIEHPAFPVGNETERRESNPFSPGAVYEEYLPKDLVFEDLCFRAAVLKTPIHTGVHLNKLGGWFNLHLTPLNIEEGKICHCAYSMKACDVSEIDLASGEIKGKSEGTAEDVLRTCIRLRGTDDFQKTMDEVIGDIREICGAEVCTVMLIDDDTKKSQVLAISIKGGSKLRRVTQFPNFYDLTHSWIAMIGEGDCLIIKNKKDMEYVSEVNQPWHKSLTDAGVQSVVMFPLRYNNEVLGFIWCTNFDTANVLRIKETLELTTFFISAEIAGQQMLEKLRLISYTDKLTGVKNRNAMNLRVTGIIDGTGALEERYGVLFADLNGLKTVNDTMGHTAGDLLLKRAALLLQELFAGADIYRAGGDEFVIILSGCDVEEFQKKLQELKDRADVHSDVCFAMGGYFSDDGCDIRDAMHYADEAMYRDKALFYEKHPERKQR
ncbi:MAG: GGDEF domain-containing protein [Lachnospiraceae bacterium]|nr:GGDEF domain-containing protein [Lachnospiraceae bacterium]